MRSLQPTLAFRILLEAGWEILPTSCTCGGRYAWFRPRESGAIEAVGCICHTDVCELVMERLSQPWKDR